MRRPAHVNDRDTSQLESLQDRGGEEDGVYRAAGVVVASAIRLRVADGRIPLMPSRHHRLHSPTFMLLAPVQPPGQSSTGGLSTPRCRAHPPSFASDRRCDRRLRPGTPEARIARETSLRRRGRSECGNYAGGGQQRSKGCSEALSIERVRARQRTKCYFEPPAKREEGPCQTHRAKSFRPVAQRSGARP